MNSSQMFFSASCPIPPSLPHAASVCRSWRRLASGRGFLGRFRAVPERRRPPLFGVFMDSCSHSEGERWDLSDVRRGRVLVFNLTRLELATGDGRRVKTPPDFDSKEKFVSSGAVVCAAGEQGPDRHPRRRETDFCLCLLVANPGMGRYQQLPPSVPTVCWNTLKVAYLSLIVRRARIYTTFRLTLILIATTIKIILAGDGDLEIAVKKL